MTANEFLNKYPVYRKIVEDTVRYAKDNGLSADQAVTRLLKALRKSGLKSVTRDIATELFIA